MTNNELFNDFAFIRDPDELDFWSEEIEDNRREHMKREADWQEGTANMHPEGCYDCGSIHHFTGECLQEW